jgi:hypothetical protein
MSETARQATRTFVDLELRLPMPMVAVKWEHGWRTRDSIHTKIKHLNDTRGRMCQALFSWAATDTESTSASVRAMEKYAEALVSICVPSANEATRTHPLEFEWCFCAETDPMHRLPAATMRSTMPAFEYACVSSCICIAHAETAAHHVRAAQIDADMYAVAAKQFQLCAQRCTHTIESMLGVVVNSAQWARLRRQGLPLQLLPSWLRLFAERVEHRAQICAMSQVAGQAESIERNQLLTSLARGAEDTAVRAADAAKTMLLDHKFLLETQIETIADAYTTLVTEVHRLRVQCLLQDAEHALYTGNYGFSCVLLHDCLVSAQAAFNHPRDEDRLATVIHAIDEIKQLSTVVPTSTQTSDIDEVSVWRAQLPRSRYTDVFTEL